MEGGGNEGHSGLPCSARVRAGSGSSGLQPVGVCYPCSEVARRADVGTFRPAARPLEFHHQSCLSPPTAGLALRLSGGMPNFELSPFQAQRENGGLHMAPSMPVAPPATPAPKTCDGPPRVTPTSPAPEGGDGPPSPLSEASSGYFSHSVSTATLSDACGPGLDAMASTPLGPGLAALEPPAASVEGKTPGSGAALAPAGASAEKQNQAADPPPPPNQASRSYPAASQKPEDTQPQGRPVPGPEPDVSRPPPPSDPRFQPPAPASPFRIQKVRTSELKSFTRMLGGDPGGPSGAAEDPPASGDLGDGGAGVQALGKLEVSSDSEEASEVPGWLKEGEYVAVGTNKTGIVRYVGPTDFQEGTWVGVELDLPSGE